MLGMCNMKLGGLDKGPSGVRQGLEGGRRGFYEVCKVMDKGCKREFDEGLTGFRTGLDCVR